MNKMRRSSLSKIIEALDGIKTDLDILFEEEEEYRDNIPENMQASERYEKADAACDSLSDAASAILDAIDYIEDAIA